MAICNSCGAQNADGVEFCTGCGAPMMNAGSTANQQPYSQGQPYPQGQPYYGEQKSKMAAGLLGIFLGSLGIGRFYLGYAGLGVAQLLVSIFTCGLGSLWGLIDGIMILTGSVQTDARGIPLKD